MAPQGHICAQSEQPKQRLFSMAGLPFSITIAGQPSSLMHFLQFTQLSAILKRFEGLVTAMQGDLKIIAFTPGSSAACFTASTAALLSRGSTVSTAYLLADIAHHSHACSRVRLMTCHCGGGVIKDDKDNVSSVINRIYNACYSRCKECGVADE